MSVRRRVAVTGLGIFCCLGRSYGLVGERLSLGRSGVARVPEWQEIGLETQIAAFPERDEEESREIPKRLRSGMSEAAVWCSLAALDAAKDAGLDAEELRSSRTACIVGSGISGTTSLARGAELIAAGRARRIDPFTVLQAMSSSASAAVANLLGIGGRSYSIASACATSAHDIGHAYELIKDDRADVAVAGGGEELNGLVAAGFEAMRAALAKGWKDDPERASRPYDRDRNGFVLGGGAGVVVLEEMERARARGAHIRGEIVGFGANSDAHDLVLPAPDGRAAAACVERALADAGMAPSEVDYVNTHGTSTLAGDIAEVKALQRVFGESIPLFSSTKSMTGHALGAAGAHELIYCLAMLEQGFVAPSINVDRLDPVFEGLPLVTEPVARQLDTAVTNSFGFGGTNAVLVVRRASGAPADISGRPG